MKTHHVGFVNAATTDGRTIVNLGHRPFPLPVLNSAGELLGQCVAMRVTPAVSGPLPVFVDVEWNDGDWHHLSMAVEDIEAVDFAGPLNSVEAGSVSWCVFMTGNLAGLYVADWSWPWTEPRIDSIFGRAWRTENGVTF